VVLVHGDWTDSRLWDPLVPLLRDRFRVIRYDWRGFGRSSRPTRPFTHASDLPRLLDRLGVERAIAVGYSGGGSAAAGLAIYRPERTAALALVAAGAQDYPWPLDHPYFAETGPLIAARDRDGLVRLGLRTMAPAGGSDVIEAMLTGAVSSWFEIGDLEREDPPVFGRLGEIRIPSVMLLGDLEFPLVADAARAIAAHIPGCRTVVVPGADHMLPLRAPGRIADALAGLTV
jgi:pimeloyl-ACP methyl ester carboxylesterase